MILVITPENHLLDDMTNCKCPGTFKHETADVPIKGFVGLEPKMYSFVYGSQEIHVAKGISKSTIKNDFRFEHYRKCLFDHKIKMS